MHEDPQSHHPCRWMCSRAVRRDSSSCCLPRLVFDRRRSKSSVPVQMSKRGALIRAEYSVAGSQGGKPSAPNGPKQNQTRSGAGYIKNLTDYLHGEGLRRDGNYDSGIFEIALCGGKEVGGRRRKRKAADPVPANHGPPCLSGFNSVSASHLPSSSPALTASSAEPYPASQGHYHPSLITPVGTSLYTWPSSASHAPVSSSQPYHIIRRIEPPTS